MSENLREFLKEMDRQFDRVTSEKGVDGWVSFFSEDGIMVPGKGEIIKGKEAIRNAMSGAFALPEFSLRWEPIDSVVSEGEDLGYTYGDFIRKYKDKNGNEVTGTGRYITVWKKQCDGSWKIIHDTGTGN